MGEATVSWQNDPPEVLRAASRRAKAAAAGPLPRGVTIEPWRAGTGGLVITPLAHSEGRTVVHFHGGGFVAGAPADAAPPLAHLAAMARRRVIAPAYRLAPEHPYPAQKMDAVRSVRAVLARCPRAVLSGDSAGAAVILWAWAALGPEERGRVEGLILIYGAFGEEDGTSVARHGTPANGLDTPALGAMYARLGPGRPPQPYPAPEGVPRVLLVAGGLDPLRDGTARIASELGAGGADVSVSFPDNLEHGFLARAGADPRVDAEIARIARWMTEIATPVG